MTTVSSIVSGLTKIAAKLEKHAEQQARVADRARHELSVATTEQSQAEEISKNLRALLGEKA